VNDHVYVLSTITAGNYFNAPILQLIQ